MKSTQINQKIRRLAWIYVFLLIWIILFKMNYPWEIRNMIHQRHINLYPFQYLGVIPYLRSEILNNVVIFIPLGAYLGMLRLPAARAILLGTGFSLVLEIMQWVLAIGVSDLTDLITNTTGTVLGLLGYWFLSRIFRNREKLDRRLTTLASLCTLLLIFFLFTLRILN